MQKSTKTDQCDAYFGRLSSSMTTAAHLNSNVDGVVGDQIKQISASLEALGHSLYYDWQNVWEKRVAFQRKPICTQQVDGLSACRELQKAFKQLIDIFQFRYFEHKKEMKEMQANQPPGRWTHPDDVPPLLPPMTRQNPIPVLCPAAPKAGPSQLAATAMVSTPSTSGPPAIAKEEDSPNPAGPSKSKEIKEEPMDEDSKVPKEEKREVKEVKEEPIDEDYPEVKEEPIADVYCPTTGTARPYAEDDRQESDGLAGPSTATTNGSPAVKGIRYSTLQLESNRPFFKNQLVEYNTLKEKYAAEVDPRTCYLCERQTRNYYGSPTNDFNRQAFLRSIIQLTPNHKAKIAALKKNYNRVFFCAIHVATREMPDSPPRVIPPVEHETEEERKLRTALTIPMKFKPTFNREIIAEKGIQPPPKVQSHLRRKCDLCGEPAHPFCFSPKDPKIAKNFFANLIELTDKARETIDFFVRKEKRVTVCRKHIRQNTEPPKRTVPPTTFVIAPPRKTTKRPAEDEEHNAPELIVVQGSNRRKQQFKIKAAPRDPIVLNTPMFDDRMDTSLKPGPSGIR